MDVKIMTSFILWFCFIASLSISLTNSASVDSRQRFRRQNDESIACPEGTKPCKDDNTMCVIYCNGNSECADGSDEMDCPTTASSSSSFLPITNASETTEKIVMIESTESNGVEMERVNIPGETTAEAGADAVTTASGADLGTTQEAAAGTVVPAADTTEGSQAAAETAVPAADTTEGPQAAAETTVPAIDITEEPPSATEIGKSDATAGVVDSSTIGAATETVESDATTGVVDSSTIGAATETVEPDATGIVVDSSTIGSATVEAVTVEDATEETVTAIIDGSETSTIVLIDNGTDIFTSIQPGDDNATSSNDVTTVESITIDSNGTVIADSDATTIVLSDVTTISSNDTDAGDDTLWTTTIEAIDDGNVTQSNITDNTVTPAHAAPVQPTPSRIDLRVVVSPEILQVQYGQTYELTCGVYGADATTSIYWIQEEPERRYALTEPADTNDKQVTMSQVSLRTRIRIDDRSKIGKYTCMAQDTAGNSGSAILTMQEGSSHYLPYPPQPAPGPSAGGYLRIIAPDMSDGDYVEIQCEGASPEDEGRIQWFFNNRLLSDEQPLYPRGKTLHIRPVSRPYLGNYRCSIPGSSYADANSVITFGPAIPDGGAYYGTFSVSIAIVQGQTGQDQAQEGSQVTLVAQPSEQATTFRWTFASNQGTVDRGYSNQLVIPRATVSDSGVYTVEVTNNRGQTARGSINLYVTSSPAVGPTGRCSIDEATCRNGRCIPRAFLFDGKDDCGDNSDEGGHGAGADSCQPNEIRCANPDRGRKCVQKFWMCDGDRDCDDGSDESQAYCELLPRQLNCKTSEFQCGGSNATTSSPVCIPRSFQCDGYTDCPDRTDEVGCAKPTVVTAPQRQIQINVGQTLTIQCVARGSPAPYINWRLNWGFVCNDGSDNGRCTMSQTINPSDPSLVTGTLTVRNVNVADGGAYSCEALNNQGFIFAVPDAFVDVISGGVPSPTTCNCNGHSTYCSPNGQCLQCQHNTVGYNCEFCAPGYQGDARRGTPYDCQPAAPTRPPAYSNCNPQGTFTERDGRCICKYNVEGDRCDQCKRSHFYLNPTTPNGCLPCFCSGVSTDCRSTDWRRQALALPLNNWNAIPKNFATDRYEAGERIQQRGGGRELVLNQNSLGRSANEVLYWKAPRSALGDVVTLYDGNIDIYFTNDGNDNQAPSDDEFIWLRGNNIDLVHKLPQSQRFKSNTNATYSVAVNERTFTRKDGTYIDRENILMALSDLDTLLIKINPIGGRQTAVLRGVTLNVAARNGYADAAPTVESCSCPANYTGSSCERCAEGYGRPHPLVGIYLGQCWSCGSICNGRSDRCDRDTGKCSDCQGNSEGDRCERCRPGYVLDARINQCVSQDQYQPGTGSGIYVDQRPYDVRGITPLTIVLDGNQLEQRIPVQVLNAQPQSVVWGRTDGSPLPVNVHQDGNDLVFRNPSTEQTGNYICTIANPGGSVDHINIYVEYRPGQAPGYGHVVFNPPSPLVLTEGANQLIQPQGGYYRVVWRRENGQPLPSGFYQNGNALQITNARHDQSGTYICELSGASGVPQIVSYEIRVEPGHTHQPTGGGPPRISIEPKTINLKEGQRMIVQYTVSSQDPIDVKWNKRTNQGYEPIPSLFAVEPNRLVLNRATLDATGVYQVVVSNAHGVDRQELRINVEPRRTRGRGQQANNAPQIRFQQSQYEIGYGEVIDIQPNIYGSAGAIATWTKDGSTYLPEGITAREDGALRVEGRSNQIDGQYALEVVSAYGRASTPIVIRWKQTQDNNYDNNQDGSRGHYGGQTVDGSHGYQYGYDQQAQQNTHVAVTVEPADASIQGGETVNLTCHVSGAQQYTVTWTKYAHDTRLPDYARQEGNSVILAPPADTPTEQMYLQCSANVPGLPQPYLGYVAVTVRGANETLKKKKKRRSTAH